jgi:hypothetical protein
MDAALWKRHGVNPKSTTQIAKIKERISADPEFYLFGGFVRTWDEHAPPTERVKTLGEEAYLKRILQHIHQGYPEPDTSAIVKSRQLRVSWLAFGYATWEARHPHSRVIIKSQKAEHAWDAVYDDDWTQARCAFVEWANPKEVWSVGLIGKRGQLLYPNGASIMAAPKGGHVFRSYTATLAIFDEAAFQEDFRISYKGALPMARRILVISTVLGGSDFCKLVEMVEEQEFA